MATSRSPRDLVIYINEAGSCQLSSYPSCLQPAQGKIYPLNHLISELIYLSNWYLFVTLCRRGSTKKVWPPKREANVYTPENSHLEPPKNEALEDDEWSFGRWWIPFSNKKNLQNSDVHFLKGTLPETNMATENRPGPKRKLVFQPQCFRCYVSFREGIPQNNHQGSSSQPFLNPELCSKLPSTVLSWTSQDAKVQSLERIGVGHQISLFKTWVVMSLQCLKGLMGTKKNRTTAVTMENSDKIHEAYINCIPFVSWVFLHVHISKWYSCSFVDRIFNSIPQLRSTPLMTVQIHHRPPLLVQLGITGDPDISISSLQFSMPVVGLIFVFGKTVARFLMDF